MFRIYDTLFFDVLINRINAEVDNAQIKPDQNEKETLWHIELNIAHALFCEIIQSAFSLLPLFSFAPDGDIKLKNVGPLPLYSYITNQRS